MWRLCGITSCQQSGKNLTSREILDQQLNLEKVVSDQVPDSKIIIQTLTVRSADGKVGLTVSQLTNHLHQSKADIVDNANITSRHILIKGLHLNFSGKSMKEFPKQILSQYERFLSMGDFNSEMTGLAMKNVCDIYYLKNVLNVHTC